MKTYKEYNINQKINAKANDLVEFSGSPGRLMRMVKKGHIISSGDRLKLEPDGIHNNRNYDGPGDDYYSGYYGNINMETNEIARRHRLDLNTPAELAIYNAMQEVERTGSDVKLTNAIIMLQKARVLVADLIDEQGSKANEAN